MPDNDFAFNAFKSVFFSEIAFGIIEYGILALFQ